MNVVSDQETPRPLRSHLPDHTVHTLYELRWSKLQRVGSWAAPKPMVMTCSSIPTKASSTNKSWLPDGSRPWF